MMGYKTQLHNGGSAVHVQKYRSLFLKLPDLRPWTKISEDHQGGLASILRHTNLEVLLYVVVERADMIL